jgi:hypothetical protein
LQVWAGARNLLVLDGWKALVVVVLICSECLILSSKYENLSCAVLQLCRRDCKIWCWVSVLPDSPLCFCFHRSLDFICNQWGNVYLLMTRCLFLIYPVTMSFAGSF